MSRHLMHLLQIDRNYANSKSAGAGLTLTQAALLEAAYSCKEKFAQVANMGGGNTTPDAEFALPDGKVIKISGEYREECVEPLFTPSKVLNSPEALGVHSLVAASINKARTTAMIDA